MKRKEILTGFATITAFLIVFVVFALITMMDYSNTVNGALGIITSVVKNTDNSHPVYYKSEFGNLSAKNLQKVINATYDESIKEEEEGAVLLKNSKNTLPLLSKERRITLFGHTVCQPLYKSVSAGSDGYKGKYCIDLYTALKNSGFKINDTLYTAYQKSSTNRCTGIAAWGQKKVGKWSLGEENTAFYTDALQKSYAQDYNDAAIVMFSREGGEGIELKNHDSDGISVLALHQDEKDLLSMIKKSGKFKKIIVLINSGNPMELGWLDSMGIDACIWIGLPGQRGFQGIANILTGIVSPSGRLTDTYAKNSLSAPAMTNGSYNNQKWTNIDTVLKKSTDDDAQISFYTVQPEGIYVGYKYYETRYEDCILKQGNAQSVKGSSNGQPWNYINEVQYPFGYGLSYTTFQQKLDSVKVNDNDIIVKVTVTNTGKTAGKDVVQVYAQTPYGTYEKQNNVEKSAIQLLNFSKTKLLQPGNSETVTLKCNKYFLASYDYKKAKSYIVSGGIYYLAIGTNVHNALNNILKAKGADVKGNSVQTYSWNENFDNQKYKDSPYTGKEITNNFQNCDLNTWIKNSVVYLSRKDWNATYPVKPVVIAATDSMIKKANERYQKKESGSKSVKDFVQGDNKNIPLASLIGRDYNDPAWQTYLNQFTIDELAVCIADNFGTKEVVNTGKPATVVGDGPDGLSGTFSEKKYNDGRHDCCFPSEIILASTFNKPMMKRRGELMGEECLYLGFELDWMPGSNIHRTPFGGRNFEYYSEDADMTYLCTIPEIKGMQSKGIAAGPKHLVSNESEENRQGICTFFNEQAFRESSLRGLEGALAVAKSHAVMASLNRLGLVWTSADPHLCTQVLKNEWGFTGVQETDAVADGSGYKGHFAEALMAGSDIFCLDFPGNSSRNIAAQIKNNDDGDLLGVLREAVHKNLYTVVNSATMNGYSSNSKVVHITPWWKPLLGIIILILFLLECFEFIQLRKNNTN